jgi:hypothetical protein
MNSTYPKNIKVPSRDNMLTSTDGYLSLKKNSTFDNEYHKFNVNNDLSALSKDQLYFTTMDQPKTASSNIYVQRHEIFPGYTLTRQVALQK